MADHSFAGRQRTPSPSPPTITETEPITIPSASSSTSSLSADDPDSDDRDPDPTPRHYPNLFPREDGVSRLKSTFDPTSPGSQILERPAHTPLLGGGAGKEDEDSPFSDPDILPRSIPRQSPSHLHPHLHRLASSTMPSAADKGKMKNRQRGVSNVSMASSTPSLGRAPWGLSGRGPAEGRFGGMGGMGAREDGPGSESQTFGAGQTFLQMINALSMEEPQDEDDVSESEDQPQTQDIFDSPQHLDASSHPFITSHEHDSSSSDDEYSNGEDEEEIHSDGRPERTFEPNLSSLQEGALSPQESSSSLRSSGIMTRSREPSISSSIHAIHRPIAARRRTTTGEAGEVIGKGQYKEQEEVEDPQSRDEVMLDFVRTRSATVGTEASMSRKMKLSEKLGDIFGLEVGEKVVAEFSCWLFRTVLLQGFAYITSGHICFYAYMPDKEGVTLRSGTLSVRGARTRRYYKHWSILKDSVLSWYPSSTDPYFPDGQIDLHYCTGVEPSTSHKNHFKVYTAEKRWHFSADSESSRDEWIKTLQKVVFRCQNEGESVKISIPLETVIDIERSSNLEFAETIRLRVFDAEEGYSIDEYWLSYFHDLNGALEKMTSALEKYRELHPEQASQAAAIVDTTNRGPYEDAEPSTHLTHSKSLPIPKPELPSLPNKSQSTSSWQALSSRLRLFSTTDKAAASVATLTDRSGTATPMREGSPDTPEPSSEDLDPEDKKADSEDAHTYPPDPAPGQPPSNLAVDPRPAGAAAWIPTMGTLTSTVPGWLKKPPKALLAATPVPTFISTPGRKILEVVTNASLPATGPAEGADLEDGERSRPSYEGDGMGVDDAERKRVNEKMRKSFGLTEKEEVMAQYPAYLFRGLPIFGTIYVSTSFMCFKSVKSLSKTKMILPLGDIIALSKHRSYRIGYSGLIVVIKGHEELFFELNTSARRDACMERVEKQLDIVHGQLAQGLAPGDTLEHQQHLELLDLAASASSDSDPRPPPETVAGQPPIMFCSTSSDFVTFRPEKSLRFTCLTIGSRGDVQPYIALCKGLMAEGHKCKIASHGEYRKWVEGHGIEFEEVGGDPAELMQLMIAHDFFTISFMKEAIGRFRGWLDDLLGTAWTACQGADVLIESPSAIAGLHIAEALRIPYYRAFTMPWSRTRAYPHAFAVPDHKMGGSYNYMTYTMFDQIFWRATSGQVNRWRKKTLGIGPTTLEGMQQHKIPFLYNFSPVVIPPPLDWRENIHVTGYWWLDNPDDSNAEKWKPPSDLLAFLDEAKAKNKKVVFIGFGSIIIPDPEEMTRVVTEAVEKSGVYAIVAKGWSDRATSKEDSDEKRHEHAEQEKKEAAIMSRPYIFNIKSIPHDWLFPRIHAAVHHGGAGTTGASLRAGLPTIIKPFFGDQYAFADRVTTLGIGSTVRNMTVDNLSFAITTAVTDEKQISKAKQAGEAIRKEDGVGTAIECIYRDLEYARSMIPPPYVPKSKDQATDTPLSPSSTPATFPPRTPGRNSEPPSPDPRRISSPGGESKNGSSDEGWDVMSRGSGADTTWDDDVSRSSSAKSKSPARSRGRGPASSRGALTSDSEDEPAAARNEDEGEGVRSHGVLQALARPVQALGAVTRVLTKD